LTITCGALLSIVNVALGKVQRNLLS